MNFVHKEVNEYCGINSKSCILINSVHVNFYTLMP